MPRILRRVLPVLTTIVLLLVATVSASSQSPLPAPRARIVQPVDDARVTTLSGNTHPLARPEFDQGALADDTPLSRIVLILQRSPEQETALQQLIDQQQDKSTSAYHQWLTPEGFGAAFGPTDRDLSSVTSWLAGHGFSGIKVNAARTLIEFSGNAGMVRAALHTTMHRYSFRASSTSPTRRTLRFRLRLLLSSPASHRSTTFRGGLRATRSATSATTSLLTARRASLTRLHRIVASFHYG